MERIYDYYGHCDACMDIETDLTKVTIALASGESYSALICEVCAYLLDLAEGDPVLLLRLARGGTLRFAPYPTDTEVWLHSQ